MSELPKGWTTAPIGALGKVQLGRQRSPDVHHGANMLPYLRVANVHENRIDISDVMEMHFEPAEAERFLLQYGDILLNEGQTRELVGRPAMFRNELPRACFTNSLVRFQGYSCISQDFALALFLHYLKSGKFTPLAQITTNIAHLGASRFAALEAPLPPLNEQKRIVEKLESLQARSRRAKAALDEVPALLEKLRQSILAAAFRGDLTKEWREKNPNVEPASALLARIRVERRKKWEEAELAKMTAKGKKPTDDKWKAKYKEPEPVDTTDLPELPEGWCWASVDEISEFVTDGEHATPARTAAGIPLLSARNVGNGELRLESVDYISTETHSVLSKRLSVRTGDVLLSCSGSVGRSCVFPDGLVASFVRSVAIIRPLIDPHFLSRALQNPVLQAEMAMKKTETAQANLFQGKIRSLPIPIPPRSEWGPAIAAVESAARVLKEATSRYVDIEGLASDLDRSLLAKAFRGELVPQDPNDEPADVMLARVKAAAGDGAPKGRGRPARTAVATETVDAGEPAAPKKRGRPKKG